MRARVFALGASKDVKDATDSLYPSGYDLTARLPRSECSGCLRNPVDEGIPRVAEHQEQILLAIAASQIAADSGGVINSCLREARSRERLTVFGCVTFSV